MGKNLIIKGADFSANAVAHEAVEPTVYYPVNDHIGPANYSSYQDGDYFFRCQHGLSNQSANLNSDNTGLWFKTNNTGIRPAELSAGQFIKIKGAYYKIEAIDYYFGQLISPYYGVKLIDVTFTSGIGYKFVDASTAPSDPLLSAINRCQVNLKAGCKYVIFGFGSSNGTYTVAIIKKANKLYRMITTDEENNLLIRRCVDFKKLESVLAKRKK